MNMHIDLEADFDDDKSFDIGKLMTIRAHGVIELDKKKKRVCIGNHD